METGASFPYIFIDCRVSVLVPLLALKRQDVEVVTAMEKSLTVSVELERENRVMSLLMLNTAGEDELHG